MMSPSKHSTSSLAKSTEETESPDLRLDLKRELKFDEPEKEQITMLEGLYLAREITYLSNKQLASKADIIAAQSKMIIELYEALAEFENSQQPMNDLVNKLEVKDKACKKAQKYVKSKVERRADKSAECLINKHYSFLEKSDQNARSISHDKIDKKFRQFKNQAGYLELRYSSLAKRAFVGRIPQAPPSSRGSSPGAFSRKKSSFSLHARRSDLPPPLEISGDLLPPKREKVGVEIKEATRHGRTSIESIELHDKGGKTAKGDPSLKIEKNIRATQGSYHTQSIEDITSSQIDIKKDISKAYIREKVGKPLIVISKYTSEKHQSVIGDDEITTTFSAKDKNKSMFDRKNSPAMLEVPNPHCLNSIMKELIALSRQDMKEKKMVRSLSHALDRSKLRVRGAQDDSEVRNAKLNTALMTLGKSGFLKHARTSDSNAGKNFNMFPMAYRFIRNLSFCRGDKFTSSYYMSNSMDIFDRDSYMNISNLNELEEELLHYHSLYSRAESNTSMDDMWRQWTKMSYNRASSMVSRESSASPRKNKKVNFNLTLEKVKQISIDRLKSDYSRDHKESKHRDEAIRHDQSDSSIKVLSLEKQPEDADQLNGNTDIRKVENPSRNPSLESLKMTKKSQYLTIDRPVDTIMNSSFKDDTPTLSRRYSGSGLTKEQIKKDWRSKKPSKSHIYMNSLKPDQNANTDNSFHRDHGRKTTMLEGDNIMPPHGQVISRIPSQNNMQPVDEFRRYVSAVNSEVEVAELLDKVDSIDDIKEANNPMLRNDHTNDLKSVQSGSYIRWIDQTSYDGSPRHKPSKHIMPIKSFHQRRPTKQYKNDYQLHRFRTGTGKRSTMLLAEDDSSKNGGLDKSSGIDLDDKTVNLNRDNSILQHHYSIGMFSPANSSHTNGRKQNLSQMSAKYGANYF